jgi:hypothetical protein
MTIQGDITPASAKANSGTCTAGCASNQVACMDVVAMAATLIRRLLKDKSENGCVKLEDIDRILDSVVDPKGEFPREFLPHFFKVVDAAGGTWVTKTESACRTVLQSLVVQHGHGLTWEQFYGDTRVHHILTHALRHLLTHLETPAGQWLWEQAMLRPGHSGRAPAKDQADQVYSALINTWRALEMEITHQQAHAEGRA